MKAPKQFQLDGADFLAGRKRALLADEPGVGKTAQVILGAHKIGAGSVRVVVPSVGIEHWRREWARWWPGGASPKVDVLSFDDARRLRRAGLQDQPLKPADVLVLDECHYAKNPEAQRSLAVFGKGGLAYPYAPRIWALSGTPAPNNAAELWPMLRAFGATGLDYESFKNYFCVVDQNGKVRGTRDERREELRAILKPFTLRRLKRDVLPELGEIDVQQWYVKPSAAFVGAENFDLAQQEGRLRRALQGKSSEDLLAFLAGTQEFSTLRRYNALLKAPAVFEQTKFEIENGLLGKVVVYGYHKEPMAALQMEFAKAGIGAIRVDGDMPRSERDAAIEHWKTPDGPQVNISSIVVAGTVVDYTAAHQVVMLEMDWVPGNNKQAWERPHRHGQENPVTVRVAMGTEIDELVNEVVLRKTQDLAGIFN